jgi:hypothetical protein
VILTEMGILTSQPGKVVGLWLTVRTVSSWDFFFEDATYANTHNQETSGQRWMEQQYDNNWGVMKKQGEKAEGFVDGFPTRNCLQGYRWKPADAKRQVIRNGW